MRDETVLSAGNAGLILPDQVGSLPALFRERVRRSPQGIAYRYFDPRDKRWAQITWEGMAAEVARWQAALRREGLVPGDRVAVMLPNGIEWICIDQAAMGLGLVVVPLFVNDRPDNVAYILNESGAKLLLIDGLNQWAELRTALAAHDHLQRIVLRSEADDGDARVVTLQRWLVTADVSGPAEVGMRRDDLAAIVFTSGTMGRPKGVMLTHGNILWNAYASYCSNPVYSDDTFLSFLPLSHTLERTVGYYLPMMADATVAYARSVAQLGDDLAAIRPTVLISVPRIYERIYSRIRAQLEGRPAAVRWLFEQAVSVGWRRFNHLQGRAGWSPGLLAWPLLRRLVAAKVMDRLGGRIRIAVCGGAPLSAEVARTFIGLGLPLVQGYGMTEASPVVSGNRREDNEPASVGRALQGVEIRITAQGELLVRSPGIMQGYLNDAEATARAIDADGWLHTGDKARTEDGRIYITGRLKEIIVLSNGEKVSPVDMEMAIATDPLFEQVMVVGEGRPYLTALLVLNRERWSALAPPLGLAVDDPGALEDPRALEEACRRIGGLIRQFPGYAQIRRVALTLEPWTVESGLLTPTLKLRRGPIVESARAALDRLYAGH
jgi:long-chain acyl-CoA synthetase